MPRSMMIGIDLLGVKLILETNTTDKWIVMLINEIQLSVVGVTDL